jgi:hypothetical protein
MRVFTSAVTLGRDSGARGPGLNSGNSHACSGEHDAPVKKDLVCRPAENAGNSRECGPERPASGFGDVDSLALVATALVRKVSSTIAGAERNLSVAMRTSRAAPLRAYSRRTTAEISSTHTTAMKQQTCFTAAKMKRATFISCGVRYMTASIWLQLHVQRRAANSQDFDGSIA